MDERAFTCPVIGCPGKHEASWHMCWVPPLWEPGRRYEPGNRVVFGGHIWIRRQEPGLWDPA
jgi:hypothetical protein